MASLLELPARRRRPAAVPGRRAGALVAVQRTRPDLLRHLAETTTRPPRPCWTDASPAEGVSQLRTGAVQQQPSPREQAVTDVHVPLVDLGLQHAQVAAEVEAGLAGCSPRRLRRRARR